MESQNEVGPIFKWQPDEDNPKANNKIILTHVAFKGAQMGSIAMTLIHLVAFRTRIRAHPFLRGQVLSTLGTSIGSVGAATYMIKTSDPAKNYDRAFRIQNNSLQNRCDKYSVIFSGFSFILTFWLFPIPTWTNPIVMEKILGVTCFGTGFGAICSYITKNGNGMELIRYWRH